jgi:putative hydrolase of the HAD superfamily
MKNGFKPGKKHIYFREYDTINSEPGTMKPKNNIDLLLFDLGGVLIHFTGASKMQEWTENRKTSEELIKWYLNSLAVRGFESGKIGSQEFAGRVLAELNLSLEKNEFLEELSSWFLGPYPGTRELLSQLSRTYRLATLSNTNELFWERFKSTDIFDLFHLHFPSFEMGILKPDPGIFLQVINSTGLPAGQIIFFDDFLPNVEAAQNTGIKAYQVSGPAELKSLLMTLGLISQ